MTHAKRVRAGIWATAMLGVGVLAACSSDLSSGFGSDPKAEASSSGGGFHDGGSATRAPEAAGADSQLGPTDNGIILVHAAGAPAFRLCFQSRAGAQPTPDSELMPQANVVGVELGSAVRIQPLTETLGDVYLISQPLVNTLYPPDRPGPTCAEITQGYPYETIGKIETDVSRGVHLFIVTGCAKSGAYDAYDKARCGADYDPAKGNLKLVVRTLTARARPLPGELPASVLHLSPALQSAAAAKQVRVTFGDLSKPAHDARTGALTLNGEAPFETPPRYPADEEKTYGTYGFRTMLGTDVLSEQTMANVQLLSAPRDLPSTYYGAGSSYVFMLLGEPTPKFTDGGTDNDERRRLHLLAVPVVDDAPDGGADAGTDDAAAR